jgi:hypothetical protein
MRHHSLAKASAMTIMALALAIPVYLRGAGDDAKRKDNAQAEGRSRSILRSFSMKDVELDDTAEALGIKKWAGTFELRQGARKGGLALDFYQDGKRVQSETCRQIVEGKATSQGRFAVQAVDLDYLPLGNAKPGHWRFVAKLKVGQGTSTIKFDVPKKIFDFDGKFGALSLSDLPGGAPNEALLVCVIYPRKGFGQNVANGSPTELIKRNPNSSIFLVRLVFEDGDFEKGEE